MRDLPGGPQVQSQPREAGEAYADAIVATISQPVMVLDHDLRVETANTAFYRTFKTAAPETEGRLVYDLGNGQWDIPALRELLERVLPEQEKVEAFRVEHEFPELGRRVMEVNACRLGRHERPERILIAIDDITDAEHAHFELVAAKEYAEMIVDAARDALLVLDLDLRVMTANETFYDSFQVERDQTEGRLVYDLGNGQWNIPRLRELLENVLPDNDSFNDFEVNHDFPDLGRRTMLLNARRVNHHQWILLAIEDVTERRRSAAALAESEERFRGLVEATAQAVWETDADGLVRTDSQSWRAYTGQTPEEALGCGWTNAVHPEDREDALSQWSEAVAAGHPVDAEFRIAAPGGGWRWTNVRAAPIRDEAGAIIKWVGMNIDVTQRREAEEEREILLGELNHRVKNIFAVVRAVAAQSDGERSAADYRDVFIGRLDALIAAHNLVFERQWRRIELRTLIDSALDAYQGSAGARVLADGDAVTLDPRRALSLCLVFHELATNAAKYGALSTGDGRVRLSWRRQPAGGGADGTADAGADVRLTWQEEGGPPVSEPGRLGFGTRLIRRIFDYELGGTADLTFAPDGLRLDARFRIPGTEDG